MKTTKFWGAWKSFWAKGICPYQFSFVLSWPLRRLILSPRSLAQRLHLTPSANVLEIGPGPGYFSRTVASRLPSGRLVLLDIQQSMLKKARKHLQNAERRRTMFLQGDASFLPFKSAAFDVVFLVATLGEVTEPEACLRDVFRVLRPGGMLSVTEQPGDPDFIPLQKIQAVAEKVGFAILEVYGRKKNFTINFLKATRAVKTF